MLIWRVLLLLSVISFAYCLTKLIGDLRARRVAFAIWGALATAGLGLCLYFLIGLSMASM